MTRGIEKEILPACRELGIAITAYGVLSRGLISGHWKADLELPMTDFRRWSPRFAEGNLDRNLSLVETIRNVADEHGATVAQIAIAWALARGEDIIPLVGARRRDRLAEALGALDLKTDASVWAKLEAAIPADAIAGTRYPEAMLQHMDSER